MENIKRRGIFLIIFAFILVLLLKEPFVGIADNSDYYRVIQPLGFQPEISNRYFYAYNFYTVNDMSGEDIKGSLSNIISPKVENDNEYFSTQFIFIKISMIINYLLKIIFGKSPEIFNIKILGILYAAIYSYGLYLFLINLRFKNKYIHFLFLLISIVILCDMGYLLYFNSFFGEAVIIASLMMALGSLTAFINSEENGESFYYGILFYIFALALTGAKVANTPIGILIGLFSLTLFIVKKDRLNRALILIGSLLLVCFSILYYMNAPKWMSQVNNYQSIFYGITKDSKEPEKDLEKLSIPLKYLPLTNTHGFLNHGEFDIYSNEFQKEVYDNASFVDILKFYLLNPSRFMEKLKLSADSSVIIRPSYLGNYSKEDEPERLSFTERFSLWSNIRKNTLGSAFYIIVTFSVLFFIINIYEIINNIQQYYNEGTAAAFAALLLFLTTMSQFVLPVIGNGEADLQKHMLLFNLCFDLMILVGIYWLINNYSLKTVLLIALPAVVVLSIIILIQPANEKTKEAGSLKTGQYIYLGRYNNEPLKWVVLNNDENGYLLWCDNAVEYMEFDKKDETNAENIYGSNDWIESDVRKWLFEFKNNFNEDEKTLLNDAILKNILSYNNIQQSTGGNKPFYWNSITSYASQNYNTDAYYDYSTEGVFLLDAYQLQNFVYENDINLKKDERYWLRTPYYSSISMVRIVDKDGFIYHKDANVKAGVIPAVYIDENVIAVSGDGTYSSPITLRDVGREI
ncbi:MAG TPA: hypothetical protein DC024_15420 [Clostridiales bacterium]|nr:hypothetical protein [Clostridiales bacterium]